MNTSEILQKALSDAQSTYDAARSKLAALLQDGDYNHYKNILGGSQVAANPRGWSDEGGSNFWIGNDAETDHKNAVAYVSRHDSDIFTQQGIVANSKSAVDSATKAITDYEKNSPVAQTATSVAATKERNKTLIITAVIIGIVIVGGIIFYIVRKNKKKKPE